MNPIMIADPDFATRKALALLLTRKLGVQEVNEAGDMETLVRLLADSPPALLLLDWKLYGAPALETCQLLRKAYPNLKIVLLSTDEEDLSTAQKAKAGFIHKGDSPEKLIATLKPFMESETIS
jgi:DNA-binding NarL/FixJ family response regulator